MTIHYDRSGEEAINMLEWTWSNTTLCWNIILPEGGGSFLRNITVQKNGEKENGPNFKIIKWKPSQKNAFRVPLWVAYMRVGRGLPRNITHPNGRRLSMTPFHSLFAPMWSSLSSPPTKLDKTTLEKLLIFSGSSPNPSWGSSPSMWSLTQSFWQSYYSSGLSTRWKQRWRKSFLVIMDKSYLSLG